MTVEWNRFSTLAAEGRHELLGFLQRVAEEPVKNPHAAGLPFKGWGNQDRSHSSSGSSSSSSAAGDAGPADHEVGGTCSKTCSCNTTDCFLWAFIVFLLVLVILCCLLGLMRNWQNKNEKEIENLKKQLQDGPSPRSRMGSQGPYRRQQSEPSPRGSTPPVTFRDAPPLAPAEEAKLKAILARGRVALDIPSREIRPTKPLHFEADDAGSSRPVARFSTPRDANRADAVEVLKDAADILAIYSTAALCVEGYTEEGSDDDEKQASQTAQANADLVKSTLVSFKVEPGRIAAVGLPGKLGGNTNGAALRITSF